MKYFQYSICENGIKLSLSEQVKTIFRKKNLSLKVAEWNSLSNIHQIEAVGILATEAQLENKDCYELDNCSGYFVSFSIISSLTETQALALGLPQCCPFQIKLITNNNIGSKSFNINWILYGKNRKLSFKRNGCFISIGDEDYRLPFQLLNIIDCIEEFNKNPNPSFDEKTAFIAELKSLLPVSPNSDVNFEGELKAVSLRHASAFSLQITGDKNSLNFNPVLFNRSSQNRSIEMDEALDEDEQIFSEDDARNFSASFKNSDGVKASYLIGTANYVFIDKSLRPALGIVKKAMTWPKNERIEFAKAPQKFIKEVLGDNYENFTDIEIDEMLEEADNLFIETKQFSQRVIGLGLWEPPDLPWANSDPYEWKPDSYSFLIQNKIVSIPIADLDKVVATVAEAVENKFIECVIGGVSISPSKRVLELFTNLLPVRPESPDFPDIDPDTPDEPEPKNGPIVLITKDNFHTTQYCLSLTPPARAISKELPSCLNPRIKLKPHQLTGLGWLVDAYNQGLPGVLLADDMGLGKTLQTLAFLAILVESGKTENNKPILVVAPVGLLKNWQEEHGKHLLVPGLGTFAKLYGGNLNEFKIKKGRDIDDGSISLDINQLKKCDWLLTTYETLRDYQKSFHAIDFSCIVYDEVQKSKNPVSLIYKACTTLQADFRIGLTGTPVENSLADLWTIMDILSPGRLIPGTEFMEKYVQKNLDNPEAALDDLQSLAKELLEPTLDTPAPVLRRMKTDLKDIDLPEKIIIPSIQTTGYMPDIQEQAYNDISNRLNSNQIPMLEALHHFKSTSLHPVSPDQSEQFTADEYIKMSARLIKTFEILDNIKKRSEKVLIFTENRKLQKVLSSLICNRYQMSSMPLIINGTVTGDKRQAHVNSFQEGDSGFDAMIISPKAGGVGLTLTAANNIIHLERWWNPAVEDQCTDRAYRIGQKKDVNVYIPMAKSEAFGEKSFDCVLDNLLNHKREIAKGLFMPTTIENDELAKAFKTSNNLRDLTLEDVDCIEVGKDFEVYVINQIRKFGLEARYTQHSYDRGADVIVENKKNKKSAIIQCKHLSSPDKNVSDSGVDEAVNAKKAYTQYQNPILILVTNTHSATKDCRYKSKKEGVVLILRDQLLKVGEVVGSLLK